MESEEGIDRLDDPRQRAIFLRAQELLRSHEILLQALGTEGVEYLNHGSSGDYLDKLSAMLLDDDAEALGRAIIDQVIHFVWALAEREISQNSSSSTH
jgi:hypothetical protein